jgi:cytoskeletal protein CcmA (bactofilin family)
MFNRDGLFGKKDELQRSDPRAPVNVTPGLGANAALRLQATPEPSRPDVRFAELPKPAQAPARTEEPTGSRLIVGPNIKLKGVEITDCDTLVVEGRVEASMDSRVVQIAENGVFSGTVSIDVAEIRGRFEGELTARKHLVIYATGRVSGHIRYGKIRIEEGGEVMGDISTLARTPAAAVKEVTLSGTVPTSAAIPSGTPASSSAPLAAAAAGGAAPVGATGSRAVPGIPSSTESKPATAAATREPAPSRAPRSGGKSTSTGVNTTS